MVLEFFGILVYLIVFAEVILVLIVFAKVILVFYRVRILVMVRGCKLT